MNLVRIFAQQGMRVFSLEDALEALKEQNISDSYSKKILHVMGKKGDLEPLGKGLYALPAEFLAGGPLHSFEIAMKLVKKGAISHRSALFFHNFTDQMMHSVYITVPRCEGANLSIRNQYKIQNTNFYIRRVAAENFFGIKRFFIGEASVWITDIEKTLLDGLAEPKLCGGFREVMHAFSEAIDKIDANTLWGYAQKMPTVISKRAGWIFEKMDCFPELQEQLESIPTKTIQKLNQAGPRRGIVHRRWMVMENF